jgi:hypothetical protein
MASTDRTLEHIEHEVHAIRENTRPSWGSAVIDGLLRGAGFTLGSIALLAFAGYVLTILGVIPGLGDIVAHLREALHAKGT